MDETRQEERRTVRVSCVVPNGLVLQLVEPFDDGTGFKQLRRVGPKVILAGGTITEVDGEFWDAWLEQNKGSSLVVDKHVQPYEEPAPAPEK